MFICSSKIEKKSSKIDVQPFPQEPQKPATDGTWGWFAVYRFIAFFTALVLPFYIFFSYKRVYGSWIGWARYEINKEELMPYYIFLVDKKKMRLRPVNIERIGPVLVEFTQAKEIESVTSYIKEHTEEGEPVFTFPEHGLYNFLFDRPAVGRFYTAVYAHTTDKWEKELLSDLKRYPPHYIVYSHKLSSVARNIGRKEELLPEIRKFIADNYSLEKVIDRQIGIYVKKSPSSEGK